eukprot:tig00000989_g6102.t1
MQTERRAKRARADSAAQANDAGTPDTGSLFAPASGILALPDELLAEVLVACMRRAAPRRPLYAAGLPGPAEDAGPETNLRSLAALWPALAGVCRRFRDALRRAEAALWRCVVAGGATDGDAGRLAGRAPAGAIRRLALLSTALERPSDALRRLAAAAGASLESLEIELSAGGPAPGAACPPFAGSPSSPPPSPPSASSPSTARAPPSPPPAPPRASPPSPSPSSRRPRGGLLGGARGPDLEPLAGLPALASLALGFELRGLAALPRLPALTALDIRLARGADAAPLAACPRIRHLAARSDHRSASLAAALLQLADLETLELQCEEVAFQLSKEDLSCWSRLRECTLHPTPYNFVRRLVGTCPSLRALRFVGGAAPFFGDSGDLEARLGPPYPRPTFFALSLLYPRPQDVYALSRLRTVEFDGRAARHVGRRTREFIRRALPGVRIAGLEGPAAGGGAGRALEPRPGGHML